VERMGQMMAQSGDRGCALANAAIELPEKDHPARAVIEEHKTHQREHLASLCRAAGFEKPERLADEIFLLLEGARVNLQSVGREGPGTRVGEMRRGGLFEFEVPVALDPESWRLAANCPACLAAAEKRDLGTLNPL